MKKYRWKTLEQAIGELIALDAATDAAEIAFVRACIELEDSDLWQRAKLPQDVTFGHFLRRMGVSAADRYDRRAAAIRSPDVGRHVDRIGMDAAAVVVEVREPEARGRVLASVLAASKDQENSGRGTKVKEWTARQERTRATGPKVRVSQEDMQLARIVELQKELAKERSKVAKLEAENEELRDRLSAAEEPTTEIRTVANASAKQRTSARKTNRR